MLKLIEAYPKNPFVRRFVDRYQYYETDKPISLKSIPNGKIEAWIISSGECQIWNDQLGRFDKSNDDSFYPASNKIGSLLIPNHLVCLNIKMNLNVLGMDFFDGFLKNWKSMSMKNLLDADSYRLIQNLSFLHKANIDIDFLDEIMFKALTKACQNKRLVQLVNLLDSHESVQSTNALADQLHTSTKTLERMTRKHFGISPKDLLSIFRFERATSHIIKNNKLVDALSFGYYDQSHFTKECKKITGYTPTAYFSRLKLPTNDLIFE